MSTRLRAQLVAHPAVRNTICGALLAHGIKKQELEDAVQDVYVKVLVALERPDPPDDVERMKALCSKIAEQHAIDEMRKAECRRRDLASECEPDELVPLGERVVRRDPVDTERQLETAAGLFREGKMPPDGVHILEGVACGCSHEELGEELGVTAKAVERRVHKMRSVFRKRHESWASGRK